MEKTDPKSSQETPPQGPLSPEPLLTRRHFLLVSGASVGSGVAGSVASWIPMESIDTWEPPSGTWPSARYGLANSATNPHASVPTAPDSRWQATTATPIGFVVGPERVYVSGEPVPYPTNASSETHGPITALDRRDGTHQWETKLPGGQLVVHDGTVYHHNDKFGVARLTALDAETGQPNWQTGVSDWNSDILVSTDSVVVAPSTTAYDTRDGSRKWPLEVGWPLDSVLRYHSEGSHTLAAEDGVLYGNAVRYRRRSLLDVVLGSGPTEAWETPTRNEGYQWTVLGGGRLLQGGSLIYSDDRTQNRPVAGMEAFDAERGERVWLALRPNEISLERRDSSYRALPPVLSGDRVFVAVEIDFNDPYRSELVALSLTDGAVLWERSLAPRITDIVAAENTVLVGRGDRDEARGVVEAYDPTTGQMRWRAVTEYSPLQLAVVDGTIFVATDGPERSGRVIALW